MKNKNYHDDDDKEDDDNDDDGADGGDGNDDANPKKWILFNDLQVSKDIKPLKKKNYF